MATIYPRGDVWYLNYSDARGQHRKSLGKISEHLAKVRLKQKEYELSMGINCNSHSAISFRREYATIYLTWYEETYPSSFQLVLYAVLDF
ncbi:hypothetical protein [Isorropodon fossajaponicum symbiont]|uniref:hypothetical protein n=1 Tax=Isorropodon fossajaponicum symbiont TaxID=883811 RepID=UPI001915E053|nr:hypothetical protein [Isorropodon fossajaponicum symbiont]